MRILGGLVFLLGTAGLGVYHAAVYESGLEELKRAADMIRYLITQIQVENASLPESICKVSVRMEGVMGEILHNIQETAGKNDGKPLFEIWQEEMSRLDGKLGAKDLELLVHLLDQTGFYDTKAQLQRFQAALEVFTEEIRLREEKKEKQCRLYQSVGVMIGLFVMILLW